MWEEYGVMPHQALKETSLKKQGQRGIAKNDLELMFVQ